MYSLHFLNSRIKKKCMEKFVDLHLFHCDTIKGAALVCMQELFQEFQHQGNRSKTEDYRLHHNMPVLSNHPWAFQSWSLASTSWWQEMPQEFRGQVNGSRVEDPESAKYAIEHLLIGNGQHEFGDWSSHTWITGGATRISWRVYQCTPGS